MTAEQGFELLNTIKLQMNSVELEKFNRIILEQVEERNKKIAQCRVLFRAKHGKNQKIK
ncbi:hypothetical protein [Empedobacter brevis]|uniref:hypothetical protein n=1 Tax=Empedobacter brevis TaxID=247 RepID=UPI0028AB877C|nr:hypothetical protein [Empedobacter brevis]